MNTSFFKQSIRAAILAVGVNAASAFAGQPGVVSNIKVLSDKVEDVSSIEAWKKSVIKEGMTDEQKAIAVFEAVVKFRQQENPPHEFLQTAGGHPHDVIKTFNVYGYNQCCCASSNISALARALGLDARGHDISHHSVPEVKINGRWSLLDASLICYFRHPDGRIASVDDLYNDVAQWDAKNEQIALNPPKEELEKLTKEEKAAYLKEFDAKLDKVLRDMTRTEAFRKDGPELFKTSEFMGVRGWFPARTHGWYSIVTAYDGRERGIMEYGYSQGYQVNVQLRSGEKLTRNWSNKGLHVNRPERGDKPLTVVNAAPGKGDLVYSPKYGDLAPGRVGNGMHEYEVPLARGQYQTGALVSENLATSGEAGADGSGAGAGPAMQVKNAASPATLIFRMPTSYIYLDGKLDIDAVVGSGGKIDIAFSDNHGLDWKELTSITQTGKQTFDLKPHVYRRYDYRVKLTLSGQGTGLQAMKFSHDVQHSQRALPALAQGSNTISFSAGAHEGTITIEGSTRTRTGEKKNLLFSDFHPKLENISTENSLALSGTEGSITFPVETPGDLARIRMGSFYRTAGEGDGWEYQVSFDDGKTFKTIHKTSAGVKGHTEYTTFSDVPPGTRKALVRYAGKKKGEAIIHDFRIDADYKEPAGGFAPVKVTYTWDENGAEKRDERVISNANETYQIHCQDKPTMKSLVVELAK